jgi:biotin carboxylase
MPRVLALYPGPLAHVQRAAAKHRWKLRALGYRFAFAGDDSRDAIADLFERVIELPRAEEIERAWPALQRALDRGRFDALLAQSERSLLIGALAARHAGLRAPSIAAARLCVDKLACRRVLARARVPQPRFAVARNASEVEAFARDHGFPLVLKPIASARGRWVTRVASREEIADAVLAVQRGLQDSEDVARLIGFARVAQLELECDPRRDFLVESYADGDVLEADGVVAATEIVSFGVTEQIPSIDPPFFIEGYALPAARDPLSIADVEAHAARAIRAVGLAHSRTAATRSSSASTAARSR